MHHHSLMMMALYICIWAEVVYGISGQAVTHASMKRLWLLIACLQKRVVKGYILVCRGLAPPQSLLVPCCNALRIWNSRVAAEQQGVKDVLQY